MEDLANTSIRETPVETIRPLRHRVLRAELPLEAAIFDGDDEPTSRHVAAFNQSAEVIGCVSIVQRPWNGDPAWQLRGMAVADGLRGFGVGKLILAHIERIVQSQVHSAMLWCNARLPAVGFYTAAGWTRVGEQFDIPTAGPHFRMFKTLR
jgi:predicted GNAT family N-acyltransferase